MNENEDKDYLLNVCICGNVLEIMDEYERSFVCHQCFKVIGKQDVMLMCDDPECKFRENGYKLCESCKYKLEDMEKQELGNLDFTVAKRIVKRLKLSVKSLKGLSVNMEYNDTKGTNQFVEGFCHFDNFIEYISPFLNNDVSDLTDLCDIKEQFEKIKMNTSKYIPHCLCGKFLKLARLLALELRCCHCFKQFTKKVAYACVALPSNKCPFKKYNYFLCHSCVKGIRFGDDDNELINGITNDIGTRIYYRCQYVEINTK